MICKRCVLPESMSDITIDKEGVCNICREFEKKPEGERESSLLETELTKVLSRYRGKGTYDCLVMISGGKDSTASLYYMKQRYKMNPLAVTFDHGFENEEAIENIKNAVNILGVDWFYYKTDYMKNIFQKAIVTKSNAPLCHICAIWYMKFVTDLAVRYRIPLIVAGWTKGQVSQGEQPAAEYRSMSKATERFIKEYLYTNKQYRDFPVSIHEALKQANRKFKIQLISPHWFLKWDYEGIKQILEKELKWKVPRLSYPAHSTNCLMNFVSVYLTLKQYGYTHYHIEMSSLIRKGELSREEALKMLEFKYDREFLNSILKKINCILEG